MNHLRHKNRRIIHYSLFFILFSLAADSPGFAQTIPDRQRIYFISDFQEPMKAEKIILKPYRNEEARDSLFADIIRQQPGNLFMLGDLSKKGSDEEAWTPLDSLLHSLGKISTKVYAIPGNHEYMGKSRGMKMFKKRFPDQWLMGYSVTIDSIAMVMLNSNFRALGKYELLIELSWYKSTMDSLDADPGTKAIIVCTHHAPYSNSKVVGSNKAVETLIVPRFEKSPKSKLFISGHSHNLEYFSDSGGKHFLVIGGGGGIHQTLLPMDQRIHHDLLNQDDKPLYFYLVIEKNGNSLKLMAKGFKRDFRFFKFDVGSVATE